MPSAVRDLVDELGEPDLTGLAELSAPCVSLYLPTGRTKEDAQRAALELRALLKEAQVSLSEMLDEAEAERLLADAQALLDDREFWNEQAEGLAVFASSEGTRLIKLATDPGRKVSVGDAPHLVPLIDVIDHHGPFTVLAMSQGQVRLFSGTWASLEPLDLGPVPSSVEDMERQHESEPELQHQHQPASRGTATFHGHGGKEVSDIMLDKFVHEVATGVRSRLGAASTTPLYLAAVEEYLPRVQATGQLPMLRPAMVTGNPDAVPPRELHEKVRELVVTDTREQDESRRGDLDRAASRGMLATDRAEMLRAAEEGRVDSLFVDPTQVTAPEAAIDSMVVCTLRMSGGAHTLEGLPGGVPLAAILRF